MSEVTPNSIFSRLPADIFRPLASPNREHHWALLIRLYESLFGPDAPPTNADGIKRRAVTLEIEDFILGCATWVDDDGQQLTTDVGIRANLVMASLIASGWLKEDRVGVRQMISMPTVVQSFLELLHRFAEEGPQFVAGKVLSIHTNLEAIDKNPAETAPMLNEAAKHSRGLIASMSSISVRARDVVGEIMAMGSAGAFVENFFEEFISKMYLGDFHELKSTNHPLKNRHRIIDLARSFRDDPEKRRPLIESYRTSFKLGEQDAEAMLEKDIARILRFELMPSLIDRLNDSFRRATGQAVSFMAQSLRSSGRTDRIILGAIERIRDCDLPDDAVLTGFAPLPLFSEDNLRVPPRKPEPVEIKPLRKPKMTLEQRAIADLRRLVTASRRVSRESITAYLGRHEGAAMTSDTMKIESVADLVSFCALAHAAYMRSVAPATIGRKGLGFLPAGCWVEQISGEYTENAYIVVPKFTITLKEAS